ncbi:MAG TPA: zinc-dependent metalloprotease, partial [Microthrixaceae bacterium]|nr:zinc-dependent metalloprotease [Microthrixaceae bacterium]
MSSSIDWALAERVAARIAGEEPFAASYHADRMADELQELTAVAQPRVESETGFTSQAGAARARVVGRLD